MSCVPAGRRCSPRGRRGVRSAPRSPRPPGSARQGRRGAATASAPSSAAADSSRSASREQTASVASAASSSAIARPSRSRRDERDPATVEPEVHAPEVGVRAFEPVLSRRAEDVDVERVLERLGLVQQRGRCRTSPAGHRRPRPRPRRARSGRALEDVGQLFVLVRVHRHDAARIDVREHHPFGGDEPSVRVRLPPSACPPSGSASSPGRSLSPFVCRQSRSSHDPNRGVFARELYPSSRRR